MGYTALLDEMLDPVTLCLDAHSARKLAEFQIAPAVQRKLDLLAERANDGLLTTEERDQYEALFNTADLIAILKLKARRSLGEHSDA